MYYFYEKKFLINFLVIRESPYRKGRIDAWSIPSIYYLSKWWPGSLAYSRGDQWVLKNDCYELTTCEQFDTFNLLQLSLLILKLFRLRAGEHLRVGFRVLLAWPGLW